MARNLYVSPDKGLYGWLQNSLANGRALRSLRRALFSRLPFPVLTSDVRDVVYSNWIVPLDAALRETPPGVTLREQNEYVILTVLTYRHGHFGPAMAGPLRKLLPSPLQSNWRFYVDRIDSTEPTQPTVLFIRNVFDSAAHAVGTRLFSDALPSHRARCFDHQRRGAAWLTQIGGLGSAPAMRLETRETDEAILPSDFASFFNSWREAIAFLCPQDAAICAIEGEDRLAHAEIDLPIDLDTVRPMTATAFAPGALLSELGALSPPFCFRVPATPFRVLSERLLPQHPRP